MLKMLTQNYLIVLNCHRGERNASHWPWQFDVFTGKFDTNILEIFTK